jgi:hypothetical protein
MREMQQGLYSLEPIKAFVFSHQAQGLEDEIRPNDLTSSAKGNAKRPQLVFSEILSAGRR